jgi:hypothetical protein
LVNYNVADLLLFLVVVSQKFNAVTILNTVAQILLREKEVLMFSRILFYKLISVLIKILKRWSPGLLKDHPSSRDLTIARIKPTVLLEFS